MPNIPNKPTTGPFFERLQQELDKNYNNKNYKGGPPVGNPVPFAQTKGLGPVSGVAGPKKKNQAPPAK